MYLRFALAGVRFEHVAKTLYSVRTVITSYSIHYTKLYEARRVRRGS